VAGREHLAQRFAIDWVLLGPDGRFFRKNASDNANFAGYGAEVIAVADGVVAHIRSDLPDNPGSNPQSGRTVTLDTITGNTIVLDLGGGRFALYAHLQPGSLKVALGDKVSAGQVLAKLGNSGNSDAPHLHFQMMDANSPLGAEGIPYAFTAFTQTGVMPDLSPLDTGQPWQPTSTASVVHRGEFPADRAVVTFP
jgi:murein DD-endopeptidase MepM/ murein hydrolase activator NlpD